MDQKLAFERYCGVQREVYTTFVVYSVDSPWLQRSSFRDLIQKNAMSIISNPALGPFVLWLVLSYMSRNVDRALADKSVIYVCLQLDSI